jgi:putative spermidine/putrescine transport system permease protein
MTMRIGPLLLRVVRVLTYIFLLAPIVVTVVPAFTSANYASFPPPGLSLKWFAAILDHPEFLTSFGISIGLGLAAVLFVVPIGLFAALAVTRFTFPGRGIANLLLIAPLLVPHVVIGISMLQFASDLGLVGSPILVLLGTWILAIPYTFRLFISGLSDFDWTMERASRNLGASQLQTFRRVVLPMIAPAIASAIAMTFIMAFDEVTIALLVSGPDFVPLSVRIFTSVEDGPSPMINAVSVILVLVSFAVFIIVDRTVGIHRVFGGRETVSAR